MEILRGLVSHLKVTFIHTIDKDDWTAAFLKITCNCRRTNKPVAVYQQIMCRQCNGLLVESYPLFDLLRFFEQLDQLPKDAYALLMAGTRLR